MTYPNGQLQQILGGFMDIQGFDLYPGGSRLQVGEEFHELRFAQTGHLHFHHRFPVCLRKRQFLLVQRGNRQSQATGQGFQIGKQLEIRRLGGDLVLKLPLLLLPRPAFGGLGF